MGQEFAPMHLGIAIAAAFCLCLGVYSNDRLNNRHRVALRHGLLTQSSKYSDAAMLRAIDAGREILSFGKIRMVARIIALIFLGLASVMLYRVMYLGVEIDLLFWAGWGASTGAATLFFKTGH
jgi:hypothetical protein